jgi:hypothetical protein
MLTVYEWGVKGLFEPVEGRGSLLLSLRWVKECDAGDGWKSECRGELQV